MIDLRTLKNTQIYNDFDEVEQTYWFDFKQRKFLHNIDTFYYSVKFAEDFTADSCDSNVKYFREFFYDLELQLDASNNWGDGISFFVDGLPGNLNYTPFHYAGYYTICLSCPDYFDIFFAPKVPHSTNGEKSVTCECLVQIRSYMLWMYGAKTAYERSYEYVQVLADHFGFHIEFTQENRIDYCWHSNYLQDPEKFFTPEKFYGMRVDRFKDALFHTSKKGTHDFDIDYIAMGKRSDKVFIRIYLKSKEVVEKAYKPWFFQVWLFNGLINRYDLYCYEYAFLKHSWKQLDYGRVAYYAEYGRSAQDVKKCKQLLAGEIEMSDTVLKKYIDSLTPKVNLVMNVEYQTMRKHTKSYELLPFFDNSDKLTSKRIYDYFDNRKLICDYLTMHVFRMVEPYKEGENDSNKSRRDLCPFWQSLRKCKLVDYHIPEEDLEMVRTYTRKLNSEIVKGRAIKACVTFGIYTRGINEDEPLRDCFEALCTMNDNDIFDAKRYKAKKIRQFNENELADTMQNAIDRNNNYCLVDQTTGEFLFM